MTAETAEERLEHKVDTLITSVSDLARQQDRLGAQLTADKALTALSLSTTQGSIDRVARDLTAETTARERAATEFKTTFEKALQDEKDSRESGDKEIKGNLSRVAWALFTALLTFMVAAATYLAFGK